MDTDHQRTFYLTIVGFNRVDLENPEETNAGRKALEKERDMSLEGRRRLINVTNNLEVSTGIRLVKIAENLIVIASDAYKMLYI
tara:strand:- start:320 stop:571 length:252 start_codon:yes stop_codon:yes gene_type:complete